MKVCSGCGKEFTCENCQACHECIGMLYKRERCTTQAGAALYEPLMNSPLSEAELQEIEKNAQTEPMMLSVCWEYACDCHAAVPKLIAEIRRLRGH